jgi:dolichol-phosphate mannosyltransferase
MLPPSAARRLVSIATYNEVDNLRALVEEIRRYAPDVDFLVIDDNSPDGTGKVADALRVESRGFHVIHRPGKLGLGTALVAAMRFAVDSGYDYLINLDADFSAPPQFLPALLDGMNDHDIMIGSRYVRGSELGEEFDFKRQLMSGAINAYTRLLLGLRARDNSNSFRCYRVEKLAEIDFDRIRSRGYSIQEEILFLCRQVGCRIGETPIRHEDRRSGQSKINHAEAVKAVKVIFLLGLDRLFGRAAVRPQPTSAGRPALHAQEIVR